MPAPIDTYENELGQYHIVQVSDNQFLVFKWPIAPSPATIMPDMGLSIQLDGVRQFSSPDRAERYVRSCAVVAVLQSHKRGRTCPEYVEAGTIISADKASVGDRWMRPVGPGMVVGTKLYMRKEEDEDAGE